MQRATICNSMQMLCDVDKIIETHREREISVSVAHTFIAHVMIFFSFLFAHVILLRAFRSSYTCMYMLRVSMKLRSTLVEAILNALHRHTSLQRASTPWHASNDSKIQVHSELIQTLTTCHCYH